MKKLAFILFLLSMANQIFPQTFQLEWQGCYGGSEPDNAYDIIAIENNYYIVGSTSSDDGDISFSHGLGDGWLIKTDSIGNILWEKTYGGSGGEHFKRIIKTDDNSIYLLGQSNSSDGDISYDPYPGSSDFWIVKIDTSGSIIWDKIVGGNNDDVLFTCTLTDDGGILAIGWTASNDGDVSTYYGGFDSWIVKLSSEGEFEWDFTIGTDWFEYGQAVIQTSDGGYLIGSSCALGDGGNITCEPHSNGYADGVLFKLDADRNIEWQQCYGGSEHDGIIGLLEIEDGYIFSAYAGSNDGDISGWHGESDFWIVKISFSGDIIWQNPLGGSRSEAGIKITQTTGGSFIVIGNTQSNDGDVSGNHSLSDVDHDIWIVKLSNDGELLSQQCIGGAGNETLDFGAVKKSDNNFVIAGRTDWGPSHDVQCTPHGGIQDKDFWVFEIKDTTIGIFDTPAIKDNIKVYPNPARDYVVFEIAKPAQGKIIIMDILGQVISTFPLGKDKEVWDTRNIQHGVYFYNYTVNGISKSGKIVITSK